jgi:hypothetical protein
VYEGDVNRDGSAKMIFCISKESKRNQVKNIVDRNNVVLVSAAEQWTLDAYINNSDYLKFAVNMQCS